MLVGHDGHVKLLDFGIAKLLDENGDWEAAPRDGGRAMTPE
jgi:serine/threonine protein kinase